MKPKITNAVIRGEIHPPTNPTLLTQDMLEVELANGVIIDVGLYPEHDPKGKYGIIAFQGSPDHAIGKPYFTKDPVEVIRKIESIARQNQTRKNKKGVA